MRKILNFFKRIKVRVMKKPNWLKRSNKKFKEANLKLTQFEDYAKKTGKHKPGDTLEVIKLMKDVIKYRIAEKDKAEFIGRGTAIIFDVLKKIAEEKNKAIDYEGFKSRTIDYISHHIGGEYKDAIKRAINSSNY